MDIDGRGFFDRMSKLQRSAKRKTQQRQQE